MRIVFDLDGTLADNKHREHFITGETKDWDAFFEACDGDAPIWPAMEALRCLYQARNLVSPEPSHQIEIWSGRGEGAGGKVREITRQWLVRHMPYLNVVTYPPPSFFGYREGTSIPLRMRAHDDYTADHELKRNWLLAARESDKAPQLVFDDRQKVVDMWRAEGIPCFQVAPGDF